LLPWHPVRRRNFLLNVKEDPMRNVRSHQLFAGAIVALAVIAAPSTGRSAQLQADGLESLYIALESQNQAGFGEAITFSASGYTPPGIVHPVRRPLASQDQAGFGEAITFIASGNTPPAIVNFVRLPLASRDQPAFGEAITFTVSGYTPPGITGHAMIDVMVAR
jgi:hypothetical protein